MKKTILTTAAVLLAAVGGIAAKQIDVVPRPLFMEVSDSEEFRLSEPLALRVAVSELLPAARIFAGQLEQIVSFEPDVVCGKAKKGAVNIALDRETRRGGVSRRGFRTAHRSHGRVAPRSVPCHANPATDRCLLRRGG